MALTSTDCKKAIIQHLREYPEQISQWLGGVALEDNMLNPKNWIRLRKWTYKPLDGGPKVTTRLFGYTPLTRTLPGYDADGDRCTELDEKIYVLEAEVQISDDNMVVSCPASYLRESASTFTELFSQYQNNRPVTVVWCL